MKELERFVMWKRCGSVLVLGCRAPKYLALVMRIQMDLLFFGACSKKRPRYRLGAVGLALGFGPALCYNPSKWSRNQVTSFESFSNSLWKMLEKQNSVILSV
jgi:hypothetical protein